MKSIVFDLDDTICFPNHDETETHAKYAEATPNVPVIEGMQLLKKEGYHITISSARRMLTHNGDVNAVIADVGEITFNWLKKYNVPYDDVHFGKPYSATYYVDDKAMTVQDFVAVAAAMKAEAERS